MKRIVLTGGGTAGHVTPNIALLPRLKELGYDIHYIGSYDGIERQLIEEVQIPYYGISSGKLRRYFDLKNFTDPIRVIKGYKEASSLLKRLKPDVVFSKGGFVSVPVVIAASRRRIPSVIHESDMSVGLANRLCIPFASRVCTNFPEAAEVLSSSHTFHTGTPIRQELFTGDKKKGLAFCGFHDKKPVLLVIGGSLGAASVNQAVRSALPQLLKDFQIVHLCGKGKLDQSLTKTKEYAQFEYIQGELKDLFAAADVTISRAGANAISELLALRKPSVLIPLPSKASRGDQYLNAQSFEKQGFSRLLLDEELTEKTLLAAVHEVYNNREAYKKAMDQSVTGDPIQAITKLLEELCASGSKNGKTRV